MEPDSDANWWHFSIDPERRGAQIRPEPSGPGEAASALADKRRLLDYHAYIGLDKLLNCQPAISMVPDERPFIVTHQLCELAFKQMIFDLSVVSATLEHLTNLDDAARFHDLCTTSDDPLWLPALTASARLVYAADTLLPACAGLLAARKGGEETFSSSEFGRFRPNLQPASGFQSAQFRLIQRALGKGELLALRIFPAQEYWKNYEGVPDRGTVRVTDPVILRGDAAIADPGPDSPLAAAAALEQRADRVLERLPAQPDQETGALEVAPIAREVLEAAVEAFGRLLVGQRAAQERAGIEAPDHGEKDRAAEAALRRDLEGAVGRENERRAALSRARAGAIYLRRNAPDGNLALVLKRIVATDTALHGKQEGSFVSLHLRLVAERLRDLYLEARDAGAAPPPGGTGGGGVGYLGYVRKHLIPLFPALVAWSGLEDAQDAVPAAGKDA